MSESSSGTALAVPEETAEGRAGAIKALIELESLGAADEVSLTLTDPDMPYERWESIGRLFGEVDNRIRWYIGDWLNFGESVFGEEFAQAVESTTAERYSEAERVTGLERGTLMNIKSQCLRIARSRRRKELKFGTHYPVAALEPDEQVEWLAKAVENSWTRSELRDAINGLLPGEGPVEDPPDGDPGVSIAERIETAARQVYAQAQRASDGSYLVPPEPMAQLGAALGEES